MTGSRLFGGCCAAILLISTPGCTTYSKVIEKHPRPTIRESAGPSLQAAQTSLVHAARIQRKAPGKALASYIEIARDAARQLDADPTNEDVIQTYNFAVARVVEAVSKAGVDPWSDPVRLPGTSMRLSHRHDDRKNWDPALYDLSPADQFDVRGIYVRERTLRPGIGAPTVAVAREINPRAHELLVPSRVYYGVTAIARFKGDLCEIAFEDPLASETTLLNRRIFPMAADFTVPLAAMLEDDANNPKKQGLSRYFNPGKYDETMGITRLEPYDPDKTIVLVIHGLTSSQATWTPLINTLRGDEDIRGSFQFWFFSYPTGYPYPYSAMMLRRELDRLDTVVADHKPLVVVGHSMGGCISRLLITDTGENLWEEIFKKSREQTALTSTSKNLLTEALVFDHRPEVGRVIFMSAPLKGSILAENRVGRIASRLIKTPQTLLQIGSDVLEVATFQPEDLHLKRFPDSVDTLAPNNRFVKAINTIPVTHGIPHHVVAGDRGRGNASDSSDGVVPYWSSHMETAESEKIIPSNHSTHQHPEGIAEVSRILKVHAQGGR